MWHDMNGADWAWMSVMMVVPALLIAVAIIVAFRRQR